MKNKRNLKSIVSTKGFTLIELLAVIVVLGIILAIAIPKITETIEKSKYGSFVSSVKTYLKAAKEYETQIEIDGNTPARDIASLSMSNKEGWSGEWTVDASGGVTFDYIGNGEYYFYNVNSSNIDSDLNDPTKVIKSGDKTFVFISEGKYNNILSKENFTIDENGVLTAIDYDGANPVDIIIPNNVKTIQARAFLNKNINTLILPSEVNAKENSFNSSNIKTLIIHDNTSFESEAFSGADIEDIVFPNNINTIPDNAFSYSNLTNVNIPNSVISIGDNAFAGTQLTSVNFPEGLKKIGSGAFRDTQLTNITLPEGLQTIEGWAFADTQLTNITLPEGLQTIGGAAFNGSPLANINNKTNHGFNWAEIFGYIFTCTKTTGSSNTDFITGSCTYNSNTITITN